MPSVFGLRAKVEYHHFLKAQLLVIDDMMMFPVEKNDANRLFHLINHLQENSSIIITTNKSPKQWAEVLDDEVLATAILDRLPLPMPGQASLPETATGWLANRKTIFETSGNEAG